MGVRSIRDLIGQALDNAVERIEPKTRDDWFELREIWQSYSDFTRGSVLRYARIDADLPLDQYTREEIRNIKNSIIEMRKATLEDMAVRKARKEKQLKPYANWEFRTCRE